MMWCVSNKRSLNTVSARCFAILYVTEFILLTMGLSGVPILWVLGSHLSMEWLPLDTICGKNECTYVLAGSHFKI